MTPSLGVVIPAYNSAEVLPDAIRSAQESGASAIVVVDDGSADDTASVARELGATVVSQTNQGAARARTRGAGDLAVDYVIFLDADDMLIPDGVKESVAALEADSDLAVAAGVVIGFSRNSDQRKRSPIRYLPVTTETLIGVGFGPWPPANAVIRMSALRQAESLPTTTLYPRFADDYELLIRLSIVGRVQVRDEPTCLYCMDGGKSVRSAELAIRSKETVRAHYAAARSIAYSPMTDLQIRRSTHARIARAKHAAGERSGAAVSALRWALLAPADALSLAGRSTHATGLRPAEAEESAKAAVPTVYVWATGQLDNIGDSLLRRPYLDTLRRYGRLRVWTKDAGDDFFQGMGIRQDDVTDTDYRTWYLAALRAATRGRITLALNAGEVPISRSGSARLLSLTALAALARVRGGRVLWLGVGVPRRTSALAAPYRAVAALANSTWARDHDTIKTLRRASVVPDWAFSLGTTVAEWAPAAQRPFLVVTLRGDRPHPGAAWVAWLAGQADALGKQIVVVSQVRRDNERAMELALALGAESTLFQDENHAAQESSLRALYSRTAIIVSDRLHALIVAGSEGAIPIGWVPTSAGKIDRHFASAGMDWVGAHEGAPPADLPGIADAVSFEQLGDRFDAARERLLEARDRLR